MFTQQEKLNALKYANGMVQFTNGVAGIAGLCETRGHDLRSEIIAALDDALLVWEDSIAWFARLSGTIAGDRSIIVAQSKVYYDAMMARLAAIQSPDASTAAKFATAQATLGGFDWSLPYTNPRHEVIPGVPFHADKTVVGPHGDWDRAVKVMHYTAVGIGKSLNTFLEVYRTAPIYPETANHQLQEQMNRFAMMMQQCARVWVMHIEVEADVDRVKIDFDLAKSPPTRGRAFIRTLRQTEILFTYELATGRNFADRGFEFGLIAVLRSLYFQEFIVTLGRANGPDWAKTLVVGDGTGGLFRFHSELTDFWQVLDSWTQAAYGFYHPVPDRTKWEPVQPSPAVVAAQVTAMIPAGFLDEEDKKIVAAKADVAMANGRLQDILASLRAKEGQEVA